MAEKRQRGSQEGLEQRLRTRGVIREDDPGLKDLIDPEEAAAQAGVKSKLAERVAAESRSNLILEIMRDQGVNADEAQRILDREIGEFHRTG